MVNYDVKYDNSFKAYEQEGVKVRLGEGLNQTRCLSKESIHSTIDVLRLFRDIINFRSIKHVLPFATSAVREADNKDDFLKEVYKETGFKLRILSDKEEALYSCIGALRSICIPTTLFFDLGGGSIEIVYTENFSPKKFISLPLGALRLSQKYATLDDAGVANRFNRQNYGSMQNHILELLPTRKALGMNSDCSLIGVGGTLRAMARYDQEINDYALKKIHNYCMNYERIDYIRNSLRKKESYEIAEIKAIGGNRAETITAGATIIKIFMRKLGLANVVVSAHGLREGVLSAFLNMKTFGTTKTDIEKMQKLVQYSCKREMIPANTRTLIDSIRCAGIIKQRECEILAYILQKLSEIPITTNLYNTFYMLLDEDIPYFTHKEQLIMGLSLIHTRKEKTFDYLFYRYKSILQQQSEKSIKKISACIILSNILEITNCKVRVSVSNKKKIVMSILCTKYNTFPKILFNDVIKRFENAFDISINYELKTGSTRRILVK